MGARKKIVLNSRQKKDLADLTASQLKEKYGWTPNQVRNFRQREGITAAFMNRSKYGDEHKKDLKNMTSEELEKKYGWIPSQVCQLRRRFGVKSFPRLRKEKIPMPLPSELEGKTLRQVQEKYNISRGTAIQWFGSRGVRPDKPSYDSYRDIIKSYKKLIKHLRMAMIFPYMTNAEIGRAFEMSRERVRQIRNGLGIDYIGDKIDAVLKEEKGNGKEVK